MDHFLFAWHCAKHVMRGKQKLFYILFKKCSAYITENKMLIFSKCNTES